MKGKKIYDTITDRPWKKWTAFIVCVVLVIAIIASISPKKVNLEQGLVDVVFPKSYSFNDFEAKRAAVEGNPVDDTFLIAVKGFSYKTASQILTDSSGNTNYSPLSLYYALAMSASGAKGETANEIQALLGISDQSILSKQCKNLYRQLYTDNKIGTLKIGNSLWMDSKINWEQDFIKNAAKNFYASSFSMDFSDKKTVQMMAKWVSENTNNTLNPEFDINADQILSIINTVYFYDEWLDRFDKARTAKDVFHLLDGTTVHCDFMNRTYASTGFSKGENFTRSSLSLKNGGSMTFILPDEGISPNELLSNPDKVEAIFEGGKDSHGEVVWQIPKFNFGTRFDFGNTLKRLGINLAFKPDADFSGITNQIAFISNIRQETHISIDEKGVEASAFTKIDYAGSMAPEDRADMILNRPFIYGITAPNGALLFMGICENPVAN